MKPTVSKSDREDSARAAKTSLKWHKGDRRYLFLSLILHLFVVCVLLASWTFSEPVKRLEVPSNIQARVLTEAEMADLRERKQDSKQREKDKEAEQKKQKATEAQKEKERRLREQRKKEQAKKKREAEKQRLADVKKKQLLKKKEAERKEQEKKALEAQKALDKKNAELEKKQREKQLKDEARERRLAEKLAEIESSSEPVAENMSASSSRSAAQISERDRFVALIRSRVESRWHIPPKSRGLKVTLRISLLPSGERANVELLSSSGNKAFDISALNAVRSVNVFPVPEDPVLFDAYFRRLIMPFSPPED